MLLALSGGTFWYARVQALDREIAIPAPPPGVLTIPQLPLPPTRDPIAAEAAAPVVDAPPEHTGEFSIIVASFTNPTRAGSLVDELTKAGFAARAVERDWGPPRGRLIQVNVGGYASPIDVQRDLQRIRELPGGYEDARIVERQ
jgi:cell division septation protein DedD